MILKSHDGEQTFHKRTNSFYVHLLGSQAEECMLSMYKDNYFFQR